MDLVDRKLFELSELKTSTKIDTCNIKELQYAEDAAIVALSNKALQRMIENQHRNYGRVDIKIN